MKDKLIWMVEQVEEDKPNLFVRFAATREAARDIRDEMLFDDGWFEHVNHKYIIARYKLVKE